MDMPPGRGGSHEPTSAPSPAPYVDKWVGGGRAGGLSNYRRHGKHTKRRTAATGMAGATGAPTRGG